MKVPAEEREHEIEITGDGMKKIGSALFSAVAMVVALVGCDGLSSEPTYSGLSLEAFNYTSYNLSRFVITDKYGNQASGGGDLMPGSGAGRLSCCYQLQGTEFSVEWKMYDADVASKNLYKPIQYISFKENIHLPPTKLEGNAGTRILGLHFYPDAHVEPEFRSDLGVSRISYRTVHRTLLQQYGKKIDPAGKLNEAELFRRTARIASEAWKKYRLTDSEDLVQFVKFYLLVNPDFDRFPQVQEILKDTQGKPGDFGREMNRLPEAVVNQIKTFSVSGKEQYP